MSEKKGINKVDFKNLLDGSVEVHHAWILPGNVVGELVSWWKKLKQDDGIYPTIKEKIRSCEFTVNTENYIDIEEYVAPGRPKKNFWTLAIDTVEELVNWAEKKT